MEWDNQKNEWLKQQRGISFEDVLVSISEGKILDDIEHPSTEKYPNQRILVLEMGGYCYLVPYIEDAQRRFLKTIVPSRKFTKKYLGKELKNA